MQNDVRYSPMQQAAAGIVICQVHLEVDITHDVCGKEVMRIGKLPPELTAQPTGGAGDQDAHGNFKDALGFIEALLAGIRWPYSCVARRSAYCC